MAEVAATPAPIDRKRKRPRAARACELCRAKKYRCDEQEPCSQCRKQNITCVYQGAERIRDIANMSTYVAELESRVQMLSAQAMQNSSGVGMSTSAAGQVSPIANAFISPAPTELASGSAARFRGIPIMSTERVEGSAVEGQNIDSDSGNEEDVEVNDINPHTRNTEFHGPTSSMAFLAAIQPPKSQLDQGGIPTSAPAPTQRSLVSTFHNNAFSPASVDQPRESEVFALESERYHFRQAHLFLDGYFQNIHYVHPIIDRTIFLARCEDLWFGRSGNQPRSFIALYYSVMSLGAIVREWDFPEIDGLGRFQWSRKLFQHASTALGGPRPTNDLETVQCLFFMAKVCQNEMNPHMAYMYLGIASRASLSAGHNRQARQKSATHNPPLSTDAISKTWWGLYSLEIETSFALGRPDSLGSDDYHNRPMPPMDDSETSIITPMVTFARIVRKVSVFIYLSGSSVRDQTAKAFQLEEQMDAWLSTLPDRIRPVAAGTQNFSQIIRDPEWARRQRLVLELRYLNVKMVLYRPFLICATRNTRHGGPVLHSAVTKCVNAARRSIELMHETFCKHSYFRTWWYNTTYILYAASIILCYVTRATSAPASGKTELLCLIDMTLEVLEVMDESVVARKALDMIKQILFQLREKPPSVDGLNGYRSGSADHQILLPTDNSSEFSFDGLNIQMPDLSMDPDLDFINASMPLDEGQFPLWSNFADSISDFRFS